VIRRIPALAAFLAAVLAAASVAGQDPPRPQRAVRPEGSPSWGPAGAPFQNRASGFGLPMPWGEESFESYRALYSSEGGAKWLEAIMDRARPFIPYVFERIRFYGLPEELAFLPVIESEYSPRASSRSGAAGLWQFMRNSIAGYGMRIDDWVDERRDFVKSTDGALRKLADNYASLGDWQLALAAYNAGLGAVGRAIASARRDGADRPDYWELRRRGLLSKECSLYVPKFLAVASLLRYPGRSGLSTRWEAPASLETIDVGRPVDIALLADRAGVPAELVRSLNAELRYGVTPPTPGYLLKVPSDRSAALRAALGDAKGDFARYYLHSVRSGDTVSGISRRYGAPVPAIVAVNPGLKPDLIRLGQVIVVPAIGNAPPPEASPPPRDADEVPDFSGSYVVSKGDTLWSISLRFEVLPELLAERNGLELGSTIREGSSLRVPILK
jgi:membrane-bound lytic murein transglycosylase D